MNAGLENRTPILGIFGGSFDPPHAGHSGIVRSFWENFPDAEELWIVPNLLSPWKSEKRISPEELLSLVYLQFSDFSRTKIWDWELRKNEKSFTEDTLKEVLRIKPKSKIGLMVGDDQYGDFHKWKNWRNIFEMIDTLLVFRRNSETVPKNPNIKDFENRIRFLSNPVIPGASSELRSILPDAIREERKPEILSSKVWNEILTRGLYR